MIEVRELQERDISSITRTFELMGWNKPASQYQRYLKEQKNGQRVVLIAFENVEFVGYLTIIWASGYPPFKTENIPEISDFNVLPKFRRKGFGSLLMDQAENIVSQRTPVVGIGVGLDAAYGAAQRLYVLRGYIPDGRGISYHQRFPKYGEQVRVDDDLNLYLTKKLR